ncbi:Retrovirus-related Pol polyprotein from transposon 412 [Merluccius polli]|uniref:Retrovirus-related Pol polyprotein from transposon 412 n=1 Tax=Merluccius polli TaxID=89951 RepID=A0AA47MY54_MERPO|nr:Retrovirus-related Pol polyprotein from transposon 412 [Merluccius polli]
MHDLLRTLPAAKKRQWPKHLPQVIFAYNTTVHSSTGYSPYELMFGRKPLLPVDALLGLQEDWATDGSVEDWVQEHQERLRVAYDLATQHLEGAAVKRAHQQPQANADLLPVGTVVYRRNHVQGRNKIQDVWGLAKYRVVRCLDDMGRVYAISPLDRAGPVKNIHRTELRVSPVDHISESGPEPIATDMWAEPAVSYRETDSEEEGGQESLLIAEPSQRLDSSEPTLANLSASSETSTQCDPLEGPVPRDRSPAPAIGQPSDSPGPSRSRVPQEQPQDISVPTEAMARRSVRTTAGLHTNPHHLPQSVLAVGVEGLSGAAAHPLVGTSDLL